MPQDRAPLPYPPGAPKAQSGSDPGAEARAAAAGLAGGTYFLGRFRVVDEIGVGGMASVHLARLDGPGGFQKWVAIKRIHPHLVEDETFVNMFLDEARVAARINHPNVATVFDLGKHDDTYWIAMEYLHGEPLREVMRRTEELGQPMPPEIACRVIADAAEGLHSAHELLGRNGEKLGLVHRDVTPHNLFVTYDGSTKVVDFGIAKFTSRMASTRAGTLKGKLAYMSPEQVAGESIDRRTDVFALGVVLWELTTGQRLFRMESDLDTLAKVQECNVPRPSSIVRGYPIDLEKIVMKALAKTKNERYRTAREFSRALQSLLMRRGLFIASDEVSAYMVSVFGDRIQKREAHLRWAAEVTQTIDIDKLKAGLPPSPWQSDDGSFMTFNSEVQPSQPSTSRQPPRPAAGMPARDSQVTSPPSAATPLAMPAAAAAPPPKATLRLDSQAGRGPAPRAGPVARAPAPVPPPRPAALAAPVGSLQTEDAPTIARPRDTAAAQSFEDYDDDSSDTIVSESMPEIEELRRGAMPAAGEPAPPAIAVTQVTQAASPVAMAISAAPRPPPPRMATIPPMPAVVVPALAPALPAPEGGGGGGDTATTLAAETHPVSPRSLVQPGLPGPYAPGFQPPYPYPMAHGPADVQRLFAPPTRNEQRTITAQALRRRVPVWAVAVGSAVLGLIAFAIVVVVLVRSSGPAAGNAAPATTPAPTTVAAGGAGPFGSARDAFLATVATPPATLEDSAPDLRAPERAHAPAPIPTANVASLPSVTPAKAPPRVERAAAPSPPAPGPSYSGTGTLKIICFPGCDQVIDNGSALGPSPVVQRSARVGSHRIKLVWSDASQVVSTIVIAGQTATVRENHP